MNNSYQQGTNFNVPNGNMGDSVDSFTAAADMMSHPHDGPRNNGRRWNGDGLGPTGIPSTSGSGTAMRNGNSASELMNGDMTNHPYDY